MLKLKWALIAVVALTTLSTESIVVGQVLTNGGFETGDFTGWDVTDNGTGGCQTDWNVATDGFTGTQCQPIFSGSFPGPAAEGSFAAYNSFDGATGTLFGLSQTFTVPASVANAQLSWQDTVNIDYSLGGAPLIPREFLVDLYDESGQLIENVLTELFDVNIVARERDWTFISFDITDLLAANVGENVELRFTNLTPETFTGPGGFGLDDVSLEITAVPEPDCVVFLGLAYAGHGVRRRRRS